MSPRELRMRTTRPALHHVASMKQHNLWMETFAVCCFQVTGQMSDGPGTRKARAHRWELDSKPRCESCLHGFPCLGAAWTANAPIQYGLEEQIRKGSGEFQTHPESLQIRAKVDLNDHLRPATANRSDEELRGTRQVRQGGGNHLQKKATQRPGPDCTHRSPTAPEERPKILQKMVGSLVRLEFRHRQSESPSAGLLC